MNPSQEPGGWERFEPLQSRAAAQRLAGDVARRHLAPIASGGNPHLAQLAAARIER